MITQEKPGAIRVFLCLEFLLLFALGPLAILEIRRPGILFLALWIGGAITYQASRMARPPSPPDWRRRLRNASWFLPLKVQIIVRRLLGPPSPGEQAAARRISQLILRFSICGAALTLATWLIVPHLFLSLPREHPFFWLLIMVLYPVLSVWPQEVIYRRFLFHRYAPLFGENGVVVASALAFGFAHVIFLNPVAVALTTAGGAMFARNYARERSLYLACMEHALYGCLVFTIGLGQFFYTGAAWHH
ncbi:CPBP family intramembrane glutamic endopeptidase [Acidocella sp.]|uniref:CPBP family intramembrane glutamic endopeptidase n=1 Tax=Acidocella sp. TaxID=50710 RepID=UPI002F400760